MTAVSIRDLHVSAVSDSGRTIEIIRGVSLDVAQGEVVALIGESGSGKTTVALTLLGHTRPGCSIVSGQVLLNGRDMAALSPAERAAIRGCEVAYVPQSAAAAFNPMTRIMEQVIEVTRIHRMMKPEQARVRAVELFRALSLPNPETIGDRYPHQVSGGQLQRLAAAMALIAGPKVVVFDEPTTALDVTTQIEVLRAFKSVMRATGIAGVYVSHDLAVVAQVADRIVVLRHGEVQETGTVLEILHAPTHPYTQELVAAFAPHPRSPATAATTDPSPPLLDLSGVTAGYGARGVDGLPIVRAVSDINLQLKRGTNLGIIGESGSGKSSLARVIAGLLPGAGTITFDGARLGAGIADRPRDVLRAIQIVFQHADTALNPAIAVGDILARPMQFYGMRDARARSAEVDRLLDMVRLPRAVRHRRPGELSGGQKQRVNFARALAAQPKLILCDEITSALDTVVASAIIDLLKELQTELGLSYIFISHDLSVVEAICDEVAVMFKGEVVERLPVNGLSGASHPYSRLLFRSIPQLDPTWLDGLDMDMASAPASSLQQRHDLALDVPR